ncbi:hypothetical protein [Sphingomonas sp.]|uniref:hypothetical protein n=1 Tax=Sphingomonas sp. TaxID=28214 RepID=UPI002D7E8790|nr:hypothetical protein [Sphingomonas sp.]HEU0045670.1 hypothetical protein [Sphingomonas sp.]
MRLLFRILLLAMLASGLVRPAAAADRITNTASARWNEGGVARAVTSNTVELQIAEGRIDVSLLRMDPGSGQNTTLTGRSCPVTANGTDLAFTTIGVSQADTLNLGDVLVIAVDAPAANTDTAAIETLTVTVTAATSGDRETLTLHETGPDTGSFSGAVATAAVPPAAIGNDCTLGLAEGDRVAVTVVGGGAALTPLASQSINVLVDPIGKVFDSNDGGPVNGVRMTIVDADTGLPAEVFAPDRVTRYPATVITGQTAVDAAGASYRSGNGFYQFPRVRAGRYRLVVAPPLPYTAPSTATAADLARLVRPNGRPWSIGDGSYGRPFVVDGSGLVRIDVPLDTPAKPAVLTKTASRVTAGPGDAIVYTLTLANPDPTHIRRDLVLVDAMPAQLRLRPGSVRVQGSANPIVAAGTDGRALRVTLRRIAPSATVKVTYVAQVRTDAHAGAAINSVMLTDPADTVTTASVAVRITTETIADRMTLVGRVHHGCAADGKGIPGVRVTLEDGSYAVTDRDGRYHFEGLIPGTHVAQVDPTTLPTGGSFVDCARTARSSATSRFVTGQGGALVIADFAADLSARATIITDADATPAALSDKTAAGAERDWFAGTDTSIDWLFPEADHNPRAPAVRVALRHGPSQTVQLSADGKPVDKIAFDGARKNPDGRFAVSLWRGVPITGGVTHLSATVVNEDGSVAKTLTRSVRFVSAAARATYLPERSRLLADGTSRPLIAVRITDAGGRPVHAGSVGDLELSAPYEAAQAIDAEQARTLSGLERAQPTWRVTGDDGIAYVALAPTTLSGAVALDFAFRDRDQVRRQRLDAWLSPGDRPWTIVGLAEGRIGRHVEPNANNDRLIDGRLALYAKGRIKGRWLLTLAYDSAKRRADQRLGGTIDPNTYYTVYADRSERRYDAASTGRLYLKLEARQFYALWGDFQTGFTDTELGRYSRAATGFKAEVRTGKVAASAFAARFPSNHRRDEIQGSGLSAGYRLSTRPILANSEEVSIEVRDRLRSEKIVERRTLTRFVDYDLDYETGALRFSAPVLSRSSELDPQFIVVEYEVDTLAGDKISAGARATLTTGRVRIGATAIRDGDNATALGAADLRVQLGANTVARGEVGVSRTAGKFSAAWTAELEHHDARFDVLAYARQLDVDYGVAEQNRAERGRRKIGVDARLRLSDRLSLSTSLWTDSDLTGPASRRAAKIEAAYRTNLSELRLGLTHADDHTASGDHRSTLLEAGATRRLFDGRLELDASTAVALGDAESIDFPARHRLGARVKVTPDVTLTGTYELAAGDAIDAHTFRVGFDVKPWAGARLVSALASQDISEYGRRAYAAYGLAQSWSVTPRLSIDASIDGERTLGGVDTSRIVNRAHPVASGGYIGNGSTLVEDFAALTLGAAYRAGRWSATGRLEYRAGEQADRAVATIGAIKQLGEGEAMGLLATWTRATPANGAIADSTNIAGSLALRPIGESALLAKLEYRSDRAGDVLDRRAVGSMSLAIQPRARDGRERGEINLFAGARYALDRIDRYDVAGWSALLGADARIAVGRRIEVGASATLRGDPRGTYAYAYGPSLGVRPAKDMLVTVGYNVRGFTDRDFAAARTTRAGPYVTAKLKLDRDSFAFLGLGRR